MFRATYSDAKFKLAKQTGVNANTYGPTETTNQLEVTN